jgi:protein-S-isoprenylcysteine O-methyltransferase Ste14
MILNFVILGLIAFLLFLLYDINSVILRKKLLKSCFFLGTLLLAAATTGIIITSWGQTGFDIIRLCFFGGLALAFLGLLLYTLFYALPFSATYVKTELPCEVCDSGVYALCRHPGVLWFTGFYLSLGLALKIQMLLIAAVIFSLLDILYVLFQDRYTFIKSMKNYEGYKKNTPFLIPNGKSIKRCMRTLAKREEREYEL